MGGLCEAWAAVAMGACLGMVVLCKGVMQDSVCINLQ